MMMKRLSATVLFMAMAIAATAQVTLADTVIISATKRFSKAKTEERKQIFDYCVKVLDLPAKQVKAHPSAACFPGSVPTTAPRITKTVTVSHAPIPANLTNIVAKLHYSGAGNPTMYSTGLYAAPGETVTVTIPKELQGKASVQIGCHSDNLNYWVAAEEDWRRMPLIVNSRELKEKKTTIANPFGGLVYLTCDPKAPAFTGDFKIEGAVMAPHYVLGQTTDAQWAEMVKDTGAPWGELESDNIILTISTNSLRQIADPTEKAHAWDLIVGACYDLAQIPTPFFRKQRIVSDVHIGGGFMHSGYPIMAHHCPEVGLETESSISDPDKLMRPSNGGANWGFFHEIGHNMQNVQDWVFNGTTEVSVNFFSLYIFDQVLKGRDGAHSGISMVETRKMMDEYFANGAKFEEWQASPFLGLVTFRQIQTDFGWQPFKDAFRRFNEVPAQQEGRQRGERGRDLSEEEREALRAQWEARQAAANQKKIDDLVTYFSDATGHNLMPFFLTWGIPVSDSVKGAVDKYPVWMPYNFPYTPGGQK